MKSAFRHRFALRSSLLFAFAGVVSPLVANAQDANAQDDVVTHKVVFTVSRVGLKYSAPCEATAYDMGRGKDPQIEVSSTLDAELGLDLASGTYQVVLSCASSEGTLKQTFGVKVRGKELTLPVKMAPAFVVTNVIRSGVDVPAKVRFFDTHGRLVASGRDRVAHPVPAGKLLVRAVVDKKAAGRRKPVRAETTVRTRTGQKTVATLDSSDGRLLLLLAANGRKVEGIGALKRKGDLERLVEVTAGEEMEVPPGTYDIVTSLFAAHDYHEVVTRNVTIAPSKLRRLKVNHAVGTLQPKVVLDGKPLPTEFKADLDLFLGEAIKPFNTIAVTETATLRPGKFRVRAKILNHKLDDGSVWEVEAAVNIRSNGKARPRLELAPARLEVTTTMGKQPTTTRVQIFLPEGKAAVSKKKAKRKEAASFKLRAGRYRVRSVIKTPHGVHAVEQNINLRKGRLSKITLDHDLGRAVVQVFEKKIAVPARVSFVADGAAAPALKLKAGQQAFLPPGAYTLIVHRGGKKQSFSAIKVAAGRLVERQVEFTGKAPVPKGDAADDAKNGKQGKSKGKGKGKGKGRKQALPQGDDDDDSEEIP